MATTRRQVNIYINGREISKKIKYITAEKVKLNRELNGMVIGSEEYNKTAAEIKQLGGIIDRHRKDLRGVESTWDKLKAGVGRFIGFAAAAFTADAIVGYGQELFRLGSEMEALTRKAEIVFGDALPAVNKAAMDNATAMGLTISQYTDAAAAIADLLVPMGFQREEAAAMSTELVNLSGALSEWSAGQFDAEQVSQILGKAILGEREQIKQLGIAIRESDVTARLAEKGLSNLTGEMQQQAKAAATLELIIEKSADAQAAYAENADLSIRTQAQLTAQLQTAKEQLATALLPVFKRLQVAAINVVEGITGITASISDLLDPVTAASNALDEQSQKVSSLESELIPLLDRYEELSSKSEKSEEEQAELAKIIARIGEITPTAITQVDEYGRILGINAQVSREFLEAEQARLEFVNKEAISQYEKEIELLKSRQIELKKNVETGKALVKSGSGGIGGGGGEVEIALRPERITEKRQELAKVTKELLGIEKELERLRGENLSGEQTPPVVIHPTPEEIAEQEERARKLREQQEKQAEEERKNKEREAKELERHLERLRQVALDFAEKNGLDNLEENERELEEIRLKFQEQIDEAKRLQAQGAKEALALRLQLEDELQTALDQKREEQFDRELDRIAEENTLKIQKEIEAERLKDEAKEEARQQIQAFLNEGIDPTDQALLALEEEFNAIVALAKEHKVDLEAIEQEKQRRLQEIQQAGAKKREEQAIAHAQALADAFGGIATTIGNVIDLVADKEREGAKSAKILAAIQIAAKTAQAIASGVASASSLPFPLNLGAIITTIGAVIAGISQAKKALSEAPEVPQRYTGGAFDVTGQQDGRRYRANLLGRPGTGMLPRTPSLVLASERGPEYFVANEDLRNPKVLNYVRAIENIRQNRTGQFQDGGPTEVLPAAPPPSDNDRVLKEQNALLKEISNKLDTIEAIIPDDTITALFRRYQKLNEASGGTLAG